jgi:transcription initiation factor TFIID subunit 13
VSALLYAHGDVKQPLPETVRVLDEMVTEFIQGVAFEATRAANYSGRQKVKYEDFEFAFRKNSIFLGKVKETFDKKVEIEKARQILKDTEDDIMKDAADAEKKKKEAAASASASARVEEELGEADDDVDADMDVGRRR